MGRIAIGVEYDGTAFCGWQFQSHGRSVQGELERAFSRVADQPVALTAAGRTDAGVHALGQVAHFDTTVLRSERSWVLGTNSEAANELSVLWARPVPDDFHARHSAESRSYLYRLIDQPVRPALERFRAGWTKRPLDAELMDLAARQLLGEHDFSAFRAAGCQSRTPVRRVLAVRVTRQPCCIEIFIEANAFLHHMVRNVVGSLMAIGSGDRPPEWLGEVLNSRDRTAAGVTAPPQGLYFVAARYPARFALPHGRATRPWRVQCADDGECV